jgi:hypothetical protein
VVEYQQALRTVGDPLLGWTTVGDRQYYVRQFRDMHRRRDRRLRPGRLCRNCGLLVAKGHARTSGASMIAGYLGRSDTVDRALCRCAPAVPNRSTGTTRPCWPLSPTASFTPRPPHDQLSHNQTTVRIMVGRAESAGALSGQKIQSTSEAPPRTAKQGG